MKSVNRRLFLSALSAATATSAVRATRGPELVVPGAEDGPLALLGGRPLRTRPFPAWPIIHDEDRRAWTAVLESGRWNRGSNVARFEKRWAEALGARYAIATASGTAALCACLNALEVGPGDEVIVPPYTFVATINVVLLQHALPVFVDSDRKTFQIDAEKIEAAITDRTRCILPVHLGGNVADLDRILAIGKRHNVAVLEDACQAHLAEWRSRKVGTLGDLGCFSFQASKNLNSGEGGAITTNHGELAAATASFHNAGRPYAVDASGALRGDESSGFSYVRNGDNRRMTDFQGALILEQLGRLEAQARRREDNAEYLTGLLAEIGGIEPSEHYEGCTRDAYHLYMFRYDKEHFAGVERNRFLEAMKAEGIPCSGGYAPLNREPFLEQTFGSRGFRKVYSRKVLAQLAERNLCPENDRLCTEAVWLTQTQLLGSHQDMDEVAAAIRKIRKRARELA